MAVLLRHPASRYGAPTHDPLMHTPHGGLVPLPQGVQQSDVCEHPDAKSGIHFGATHMPVASGLLCWQTNPGAHTGDGTRMFPPHGPPAPETQPQDARTLGRLSQVASAGHVPPQTPDASAPQGRAHSAAGPGQQAGAPAEVRQMHACSHIPSTQRSTVHASLSLQSASVSHVGAGVGVGAELGRH